jgi:hypothetical protein
VYNPGDEEFHYKFFPPKNLFEEISNPENYFSVFIDTLIKIYRGKVKYWEIWNEPEWIGYFHLPRKNTYPTWFPCPPANSHEEDFETGRVMLYKRMCEIADSVIKSYDPLAKILVGSLEGGITYENNEQCIYNDAPYEFLKEYFEIGGSQYGDIVSIHPYNGVRDFSDSYFKETVDFFRNLMSRYGWEDRELWITEAGIRATEPPIPGQSVSLEVHRGFSGLFRVRP